MVCPRSPRPHTWLFLPGVEFLMYKGYMNRFLHIDLTTHKYHYGTPQQEIFEQFIGGKGDFTVNIALIENGEPVKGVIYIPNWDEVYYGEKGGGVNFEREKTDEKTGVVSRSHSGEEELAILEEMDVKKIVHVGSSIKFCWLASGKADVYVRKTPLMIWDMAAAYAICGEVGVQIRDFSGNRIDFSELTVPGIRAF